MSPRPLSRQQYFGILGLLHLTKQQDDEASYLPSDSASEFFRTLLKKYMKAAKEKAVKLPTRDTDERPRNHRQTNAAFREHLS